MVGASVGTGFGTDGTPDDVDVDGDEEPL